MGWVAWRLDAFTWLWIAWLAWFVLLESAAVATGYRGTLTAHLRPLLLEHPLAWWLGVGAWCWAGVHLFAPSLERWLLGAVVVPPGG